MSAYAGKVGEVGIVGAGMMGGVGILNVGAGDTKLSFDPKNPAERIRAARIVKDMIRRGYALMIEVERDGEKKFVRAHDFDEAVCEYVIADFDPLIAADVDQQEEVAGAQVKEADQAQVVTAPARATPRRGSVRRVPAESTRAVSVGKTSGG